ncbi:MAG TPA: BamA/TamA family outer membrane protein, partial [Longimicrobiales bacterium]|nr:BamA/TamA family outer membrane protein [Longimicrobiales bacterium]
MPPRSLLAMLVRSLCAVAPLALGGPAPLAAQQPVTGEGAESGPSLILVDADTRVESVGFRFLSGPTVEPDQIRPEIATRGPGALTGLRDALDFLPGISPPERPPFSPLQLQMDVARIRRLYEAEGFRDAQVDYEVALDTTTNRVSVDFVIDEGEPLVLGDVAVEWEVDARAPASAVEPDRPQVPPELEAAWAEHVARMREARGQRLAERERARLEMDTAEWFLQRGYPWVYVRSEPVDTTERSVDVRVIATPGPRARVDEVRIEGNVRLTEEVLRREIAIRPGDWYDERAVSAGEAELYGLELVRQALGNVAPGQEPDSTVTLLFRVEESLPRLVWGRVGWRSEAGASGEAHWSHRNFWGGARVLTISAAGESGLGALEQAWGRSAGVSAQVLQPHLWHRHVSATAGPFLTWRDDYRDRSVLYGIESAVIYQRQPLQTVSLEHEISRLAVQDAMELLPVGEVAARGYAPFSPAFLRSIFRLSVAYGWLDDRMDPRSGFLVEPTVEATGPLSDVSFVRVAGDALAAIPLGGRFGLYLHGGAGRVFPYGESDSEGPGSDARALAGLRSSMFTAGGTADVRGWGAGMLGPKVPEIVLSPDGVVSERYLPVGGLARLSASAELALPFPFLPAPHRTFVFLDAGRVWSPGDRFL